MRFKVEFKRTISSILAVAMTFSITSVMPAAAEETAKYPYAIFAADEAAGISVNTDSFTLNGNAYTNGVFSTTAQYPNINGTVTDHDDIEDENNTEVEETEDVFDVSEDMILIHTKLADKYFTENCDTYNEDYTYSDMNININNSVYVTGKLNLYGNISLNNAVGAVSDVDLSGGNLNGNNTVIYSKFGDIDISNSQASVNGLIYAPFGTVTIDCDNFNMNGLIIAQNVVIDGYGANINYSSSWAELVGTESEELSWTFDDWQYLADTDDDGLPNLIEKEIGSDPYNPDTDGDNLPDGYEALTLGTDPTKPDTDENGVSDYDEDFDNDGLSNGQEYELGTGPYNEDTDGDGLKGGEEVNDYHTDPLNPDTDKDGVNDGDEIVLGLDPLKLDTDDNGVLDCDEYFEQTVDQSRFDSDLFEDNLAVPSLLTVSAKGNVNSNIDISEYTGHLKGEERVYVGKVIEITKSEINSGNLSFTLSEDYTVKNYELAGELTNGLLICYNDGENTTPLATTYDEETRTLSADISAEGIYFVLDVISWLESLGLDIPSETSVEAQPSIQTFAARAVSDAAASIATVQIKGQVDIVFVIDTTGSMSGYINNVKNNITAFVNEIESAGITPSFALVDYRDITCDGENSTNTKKNPDGDNWFKNADDFKAEIAKLTVDGGGDTPETAIDALEMARQLNLRTSSQKFFVLVTDAGYKIDNNYGIKSMSEMIDLLVDDDINVSVVSNSSYQSTYKSLYESTGGIFANVGGNFKDELLSIADMINEETNSGCWVALNGLIPQIVKLDERPVWNGTADTDKDSLLDREELKSVWPTKYIDVSPFLYLLGLPWDYEYPSVPAYDYYSNPTKEDTDKDGIYDEVDNEPRVKGYYDEEVEDIVIGELTIVSCSNPLTGHGFLVYKSAVNDTLDFTGFVRGYTYQTWNKVDPCFYDIQCGQSVSIGNAGAAVGGSSVSGESGSNSGGSSVGSSGGSSGSSAGPSSGSSSGSESDVAGIYFNREFAVEANNYKENYDSSNPSDFKQEYDKNYAYTKKITQDQWDKLIQYHNDHNTYDLLWNNCVLVATRAWNLIYQDDQIDTNAIPSVVKNRIKEKSNSFVYDLYSVLEYSL